MSPNNLDLAYNYYVLMSKHRRLDQSVLTCYYILLYMYATCQCYIFMLLAYGGIFIIEIWCFIIITLQFLYCDLYFFSIYMKQMFAYLVIY
jgi:hypothetical protein